MSKFDDVIDQCLSKVLESNDRQTTKDKEIYVYLVKNKSKVLYLLSAYNQAERYNVLCLHLATVFGYENVHHYHLKMFSRYGICRYNTFIVVSYFILIFSITIPAIIYSMMNLKDNFGFVIVLFISILYFTLATLFHSDILNKILYSRFRLYWIPNEYRRYPIASKTILENINNEVKYLQRKERENGSQ